MHRSVRGIDVDDDVDVGDVNTRRIVAAFSRRFRPSELRKRCAARTRAVFSVVLCKRKRTVESLRDAFSETMSNLLARQKKENKRAVQTKKKKKL